MPIIGTINSLLSLADIVFYRHSRAGGNPVFSKVLWIPAFAGIDMSYWLTNEYETFMFKENAKENKNLP
jgi:hypothetical protein